MELDQQGPWNGGEEEQFQPLENRLTRLQVRRILADRNLNKCTRGYYRAFAHGRLNPEPRRSGGHFKISPVHATERREIFHLLSDHTKLGDLGTQVSMPTRVSNIMFRRRRGWNPMMFPIFVHTYDANDDEDKMRICENLNRLGFDVRMADYKTSGETDADRERFGG